MNTCKHCGKAIDDSYKFCVHCGTSCQESMNHEEELATKICPECGRSIGIFCKFCVYCGSKCQTEISLENLFWNVDAYQWLPQIVRQLAVLQNNLEKFKENSNYDYIIKRVKNLKSILVAPPQVMIVGSFSTGKSTFLNALFGESIAKVGALPTTAITTKLSYGPEDTLLVHLKNGNIKKYGIEDFDRLTSEGEEWQSLHDSILYVERFLPNELLKNFSIIDSPGLDAKAEHTNQTKNFIERADVILWMFSAEHAVSAREVAAIKELDSRYKPVAIINKIDTLDEEEDDLDDLLHSIKEKLNNLVSGIYPVSAQLAFQGKESGNECFLKESLITHLEEYLNHDVIATSESYRMQVFLDIFASLIFEISEKISESDVEYNKSALVSILVNMYESCQETIKSYKETLLGDETASLELYCAAKELLFITEKAVTWKDYSESSYFEGFCSYLVKAASREHPLAIFWLALLCVSNDESDEAKLFVDKNKQWIETLEFSYKKDPNFLDTYAMNDILNSYDISSQLAIEIILSMYYRNRDSSLHVHYLKLASSHGSNDAKLGLATYYESQGNLIKAKLYWESLLSEEGHTRFVAYNNLGLLYMEGTDEIPKDLIKATEYLSIASQNGDPDIIRNYVEVLLRRADIESFSNQVNEWEHKVIELLESIYKQSSSAAEVLMAIYMQGLKYIEPSHQKAFEIFKQTYEPTDTMRFLMAQVYVSGQYGGPQDCIKALAVSQPLAPAERLYIEGVVAHIQNNMEQARISLQKSADLGFEPAKEDLKNGLDTITYGGISSKEDDEEVGWFNTALGVCIFGGIIISFPPILIVIIIFFIVRWIWKKNSSK